MTSREFDQYLSAVHICVLKTFISNWRERCGSKREEHAEFPIPTDISKIGSKMGLDFSHRHKKFDQQVKSWTDRLAIAAALSNRSSLSGIFRRRLPDMLLKP
ncbi:hypothetical protein PFLUV_G00100540 [Perca fluviatilis]|uniref:Uncharacterized protein n=1 Tax=Perca fluviatilis TaxID=8168 RepID=A0A6A5FBY4_PERFL|nr:hypothetical protein PFLUV_G00100540 [Perca fluviatilis]